MRNPELSAGEEKRGRRELHLPLGGSVQSDRGWRGTGESSVDSSSSLSPPNLRGTLSFQSSSAGRAGTDDSGSWCLPLHLPQCLI